MPTLVDALRVSMMEAPTRQVMPSEHPATANVVYDPAQAAVNDKGVPRATTFANRREKHLVPPRHQLGYKIIVDRDGPTVNPAAVVNPGVPSKSVLDGLAKARQPPVMYSQ